MKFGLFGSAQAQRGGPQVLLDVHGPRVGGPRQPGPRGQRPGEPGQLPGCGARRVANLVEIVAADLHIHPRHALERFGGCTGIWMVRRVARVHSHAFARQQPGRRDPAFAEPDDCDDAAGPAPLIGHERHSSLLDHRTLSVASAIIALSTPRM